VKTQIEFQPDHYSETAGLGLYYDSNNWLYAHLTYCERSQGTVLTILQAKWGERTEYVHHRVAVHHHVIELKMHYDYGVASFYYRMNKDDEWAFFEGNIDVDYLSDEGVNGEPGEIGGFTGLFNFIGSVDSHQHDSYADFDYYAVEHKGH
jgi:xylan 1,4-beta-xylosidase